MSLKSATHRLSQLSRPLIIALVVIVLALGGLIAWQTRPKEPKDPYRIATVERGDITRLVSASGELQALEQVEVGSQISGLVQKILVDFNDPVRQGQPLAIIDPQTYQSRVAQSQADVQAGIASLRQAEAQLANLQADYARKSDLVQKKIYAPSVLDQATAAFRTAQAAVTAARARIGQSEAQLRSQRVDLARTTISSPIDGIVIDRKVEPGQTVAASFQAPVLFTIAQDLSKMEVKVSVDEADVGQVQEGQMVRFTVDAFPDDTFEGVVTQVRKQPVTEQNVVAYVIIAKADNPQRKLLPGMTANADIILETRPGVLRVLTAALRWNPPSEGGAGRGSPVAVGRAGFGGGGQGGGGPGLGGGGFGGSQGGGRERMIQQLNLDAKQRTTWETIQVDLRQKSVAAFASAGGDRRAVRTAMQKNLEDALANLEPQLRPDQKTKLVALRVTMATGRPGSADGQARGMRDGVVYVLVDGKPTPVPVRVGATDGTGTEIVGPLKPGDQVIVGGGPRPKVEVRSPFGGGRFRIG